MNARYLRFPQGKSKAFTLSYDDGVEQDIRLIRLMEKHGVRGTFNLNSGAFAPEGTVYPAGTIHRRLTASQCAAAYASPAVEAAVHTLTHPFLERLPLSAVMTEVVGDRQNLEEMTGRVIRGMAYPFGTYSDEVVEVLRAAGIAYARTTISTGGFDLPRDWLRLPATCHHNSPQLMTLAEKFCEGQPVRDPYLFYLWGHSYEFERDDNWFIIEEFFDAVACRSDVWYATNIELYDYIWAWEHLRCSADGGLLENPTACPVWVAADGKTIEVPAGGTVRA